MYVGSCLRNSIYTFNTHKTISNSINHVLYCWLIDCVTVIMIKLLCYKKAIKIKRHFQLSVFVYICFLRKMVKRRCLKSALLCILFVLGNLLLLAIIQIMTWSSGKIVISILTHASNYNFTLFRFWITAFFWWSVCLS